MDTNNRMAEEDEIKNIHHNFELGEQTKQKERKILNNLTKIQNLNTMKFIK